MTVIESCVRNLVEGISGLIPLDINTFQIGQEWFTFSHDNQENPWYKWHSTTDGMPASLAQTTEVHIVIGPASMVKAMAYYSWKAHTAE